MRFTAPGRISNYEISGLRKDGIWRGVRWQNLWSSLSDTIHPASLDEWRKHMEAQED